jgi:thioesterase domain-containing protein/acyl carrier protein
VSDRDEVRARLRTILRTGALDGSDRDIADDLPLGEEGIGLDSLALVDFLTSVEREFATEIPVDVWAEVARMSLDECAAVISGATAPPLAAPEPGADGTAAPEPDGDPADADPATMARLGRIWSEVLGVPSVGPDEDFLRLQGDRDLVEEMVRRTCEEFGVAAEGPSLAELERHPTIRALAARLGGTAATGASLVVPLRTSGTGAPLFLVHAGAGYVFFYRELAMALDPPRPVFGVRAENPREGRGRPFAAEESIESVAARYIDEIRGVRPEGPYLLGGACAGGLIAVEMARQLLARGERLAGPVLVFDSLLQNNGHVSAEDREILRDAGLYGEPLPAALRRRGAHLVARIRELGPVAVATATNRRLRRFRRTGATAAAPGAEGTDRLGTREMAAALDTSGRLMKAYQPRALDASVVFFQAEGSGPFWRSWNGIADRGLVVHDLPGGHLTMMEHPLVPRTAALVTAALSGS